MRPNLRLIVLFCGLIFIVACSSAPAPDDPFVRPTATNTATPAPANGLPSDQAQLLTGPCSPKVRAVVELASLRAGPNTRFPLIGQFGQEIFPDIIGRYGFGQWWYVESENGFRGWVFDSAVTVFGDTSNVPVVAPPLQNDDIPKTYGAWEPTPSGNCETPAAPPVAQPIADVPNEDSQPLAAVEEVVMAEETSEEVVSAETNDETNDSQPQLAASVATATLPLPTATALPTNTPIVPTNTPLPPTNTPEPVIVATADPMSVGMCNVTIGWRAFSIASCVTSPCESAILDTRLKNPEPVDTCNTSNALGLCTVSDGSSYFYGGLRATLKWGCELNDGTWTGLNN